MALTGPNNCGKTTVFHILSGFTGPSSGTVCLEPNELLTHTIGDYFG